jgi:WD40 repeat protein
MNHGGRVYSASFSRDGRRIVTASSDKTARVWDAQTGQALTEPMAHGGQVRGAQFSPDGKHIVTASLEDKTARIWDARTGKPLTEPFTHDSGVLSAQFSPDGKRILTLSGGTARIWDVGPTRAKFPDWLLQLSEVFSGEVLNKQGVLEPTKLNRFKTVNEIREKLNQEANDDDWVVWGRWLLGDRATRTISPFSNITVPEYIESRIKENTRGSLAEAEQLADKTEVLQRISEGRTALREKAKRDQEAKEKGPKSVNGKNRKVP